jgi:alpha-galactosidase
MPCRRVPCAVLLFVAIAPALFSQKNNPAPTPPIGWNSWDAYGFTIDEAQFKANALVLAGIRSLGWQYAVIDEGWYMRNPFGGNLAERDYLYDANGLLLPVEKRFPSAANGAGFKPLADWVHAQGLKFGIHIVRGIPKQVVEANLPIAGSGFHAADAADMTETCPWDDANYGVKDNAAGQAYYDSMLRRYAGWGLDFIKVDCIADHPWRPTEIRQIAEAIRKTGRPIVLSLSPGPTNLAHAGEAANYAQMTRIADDHWDAWAFPGKKAEYPFGLSEEFDRIAAWSRYARPGFWPDADMLPEGSLTPHPGRGEPRQSHYTKDEQRTEVTLWAVSRSPLIFGGNLTKLDDFTRSLLTNREVLEIDQKAVESAPVLLPAYDGAGLPLRARLRAWYARVGGKTYAAVFNPGEEPVATGLPWESFHLQRAQYAARDVWTGKRIPAAKALQVELAPHACALFRVE